MKPYPVRGPRRNAFVLVAVLVVVIIAAVLVFMPHGPTLEEAASRSPSSSSTLLAPLDDEPTRRGVSSGAKKQQQKPRKEDVAVVDGGNGGDNSGLAVPKAPSYCDKEEGLAAPCIRGGELILPFGYPVHRALPSRESLKEGLDKQRKKQCDAPQLLKISPLMMTEKQRHNFELVRKHLHDLAHKDKKPTKEGGKNSNNKQKTPTTSTITASEQRLRQQLEDQFETPLQSPLFFKSDAAASESLELTPWWVPFDSTTSSAVFHNHNHNNNNENADGDAQHQQQHQQHLLDLADRLPCTEEVQALLHRWQNPPESACNDATSGVRALVSPLKAGAHGVGSAITLLAHDFLSALLLHRRFAVAATSKWFFAPAGCDRGWECLFAAPTSCKFPGEKVHVVSKLSDKGWARMRLVTKQNFDMPGLSRNDFPSIQQFFDVLTSPQASFPQQQQLPHFMMVNAVPFDSATMLGKCVPLIRQWAADSSNRVLMGTFRKGTDPILIYEMAQVTAYLMRAVQPWFKQLLAAHLRKIVLTAPTVNKNNADLVLRRGADGKLHEAAANEEDGDADHEQKQQRQQQAAKGGGGGGGGGVVDPTADEVVDKVGSVVFVHDRGELAKYREYYNSFGCHKISQAAFVREVQQNLCPVVAADNAAAGAAGHASQNGKCLVFVSGNMPHNEFDEISQRFAELNHEGGAAVASGGAARFVVRSTWNLQSQRRSSNGDNNAGGGAAAETARWGAAHPAASWVDLFAGAHATGWTCVVQSNWCRVIDFLRMTLLARAACPFVDVGMAALADDDYAEKYCTVRADWPAKPYRGSNPEKGFRVK